MGKPITKTMKYQIHYIDGCGDFHNMQKELWDLQKITRQILNKTATECYLWWERSDQYYRDTGENINIKAQTGYKTLDGHIYNILKVEYGQKLASTSVITTIQSAYKKMNDAKKDIKSGIMSIPMYRSDQPILIPAAECLLLSDPEHGFCIRCALFSQNYKDEHEYERKVRFKIVVNDNTQRSIFEHVLTGKYKHGQCSIVYEKKKWFLLLTYQFVPEETALDPEKILGVDLGCVYALYASSKGNRGTFKIAGDEAINFIKRIEARKHSRQLQGTYCGDGRIGHGTKTRVQPVYNDRALISNFQDTINHRYSKALIDYAKKNGYGTIQMEDLSGIKEAQQYPNYLQHWTYYDLQLKIQYKAKEAGIEFVKVTPKYTSQRCSHCGNIDEANRPKQDVFRCTVCGYERNADYNASQNLSIKGIDRIIDDQLKQMNKANPKKT